MDFQTLSRRELQALCKLNKIPANMTNIAMADALKSLETVEGIEGFLNHSTSKTGGLSIESPKRIEVSSPRVLHTSPKTTTWQKVSEVMETSLVSCTSKKVPEASSCHSIPNTPVVTATINQGKGAKTTHKGTIKKETTATVQSSYTARRSTRLAAKKLKHDDVVVLDESDENLKNEKVVHVDTTTTTLESGMKIDNLKVKLDEIFGQIEDVDIEERQNGEEVVNADGMEKNVSVNTGDIFVNHKKQKACMNLESLIEVLPIRKKAKIDDVNESLKVDDHNVVKLMSAEDLEDNTSKNMEISEPVNLISEENLDKCIEEKNNVVVLDESDEISKNEKIVEMVDCCGEVNNLKVKSVEIFENADLEERQNNYVEKNESLIQEIGVDFNSQQVNLEDKVAVIDNPTLINSEVLDSKKEPEVVVVEEKETNNEKEAVKDEKPKSVNNSPSLRQLKKKLKDTLLNSPTPITLKTNEVSDNKENNNTKQPQAVVGEEREIADEKAAKSLNSTCSLRQLRKQLKAISGKCNMDANKDDSKDQ